MGIQGLQEYVEANCPTACQQVDLKAVLYGKKVNNTDKAPRRKELFKTSLWAHYRLGLWRTVE